MELDKTILSEVTQTQKDEHGMFSIISKILDLKQRITRLQFTVSEKLGKKEYPKRDMQGGSKEEGIVKIFRVNWEGDVGRGMGMRP